MPEVADGLWREGDRNISKQSPSPNFIPLQGDQSSGSVLQLLQVSPGCWCTKKAWAKFTEVRSIQIHCTVLWLSDLWANQSTTTSRDDRTDSDPCVVGATSAWTSFNICKILQKVCRESLEHLSSIDRRWSKSCNFSFRMLRYFKWLWNSSKQQFEAVCSVPRTLVCGRSKDPS